MSSTETSETWKNVSKGTVVVWTLDHKGHLEDNLVRGGNSITLTTAERKKNEGRARKLENSPFRNGLLQPTEETLKLLDGSDDYESIALNPNHISESEMEGLFKLPVERFRSRLSEITNVVALGRLQELAEGEDSPATVPQLRALAARRDEVDPSFQGVEADEDDNFLGHKTKPVYMS